MRILVVGAGAIGGVTGGYLARAGEDVLLVDRVEEHVEAIQTNGLRITGIPGDIQVEVPAVTPDELSGEFDLILIAVKSAHSRAALEQIKPLLNDDTIVISFQNGLNNKSIMTAMVGSERTIGAMVRLGAAYRGPGHVEHLTHGIFVVGEMDGRMTTRLETVRALLDQAAPTQRTDNLYGWLWAKQTYGCLVSSTVLIDVNKTELLTTPYTRELMLEAMRECARVARASGVELAAFDFLDPNALLGNSEEDRATVDCNVQTIIERFGHGKGGVRRDILVRKIPSEVPYTAGEVVEQGEQVGVSTPVLTKIVSMIAEIESGDRRISPDNMRELESVYKESRRVSASS